MSRLNRLIAELCPDGVEYRRLGDVCIKFIVPMRDRPKMFDGNIPWCRIEDIEGHYLNTSLSEHFVSEKVIKEMNLKIFPTGTVVCSCSASLGTYAINTQPLITNQTFIGIVCGKALLNRFLLYLMETKTQELTSISNSGTIPYISRKKFEDLIIPLPPLPIQEEIVRILDKFTELETELETELDLRKKQYEYYRDTLLDFSNKSQYPSVRWMKLGEIGTLVRGSSLQKKDFTDKGVGCIHYGQIYTYYRTFTSITKSFVSLELAKTLKKVNKNDLIITNTSENVEDVCKTVAWLGDHEIVTGGHATIFKHNENPKYLAYYTQTPMFFNEKKKIAFGTKVTEVSVANLAKIKIPIPPLSEQKRIVNILDRFDKLTNDISVGLPAEIAARHKQYEHYRDSLLSFKEKVS